MPRTLFIATLVLVVIGCSDHIAPSLPHAPRETIRTIATAIPRPHVPNPKAEIQLDVQGNGDKQTEPFLTSGPWSLHYSFDCVEVSKQEGLQTPLQVEFTVLMLDADGHMEEQYNPVTVLSAQSAGTMYYDTATPFTSLAITGACPWHVTVIG